MFFSCRSIGLIAAASETVGPHAREAAGEGTSNQRARSRREGQRQAEPQSWYARQ